MISFASPAREHAALSEAIEAAAVRVLRSGSFILGREVELFEAELASATGSRHAVAVSSGSDALVCALHALGLGPGHQVIVPAFGFVSAAEAVLRVGAQPRFVDIESGTLGPDPSALAAIAMDEARPAASSGQAHPRIAPDQVRVSGAPDHLRPSDAPDQVRAIIVMHLFGQAVPLEPIRRAFPGLPIIEDAAQGMGTLDSGKQVGTLAEIGTLSFFPAKSLGAAGDGGAVLTSDPNLAAAVNAARSHGSTRAYRWDGPGGNYRLDALQAAVLRVKLAAFPARIERRRSIGLRLAAAARKAGFETLMGAENCTPTFAPFAIRLGSRAHAGATTHNRDRAGAEASIRDQVGAALREKGIDVRIQYPATLPGSPAFATHSQGTYPEAVRATKELLSLPCHAELTDDEVAQLELALTEILHHV